MRPQATKSEVAKCTSKEGLLMARNTDLSKASGGASTGRPEAGFNIARWQSLVWGTAVVSPWLRNKRQTALASAVYSRSVQNLLQTLPQPFEQNLRILLAFEGNRGARRRYLGCLPFSTAENKGTNGCARYTEQP